MTANDYTLEEIMSHISSINPVNDGFSEHYAQEVRDK